MIRAFQWDLARQVERLDWLLGILPRYADWVEACRSTETEAIIQKVRQGRIGKVDMQFDGARSRFYSEAKQDDLPYQMTGYSE